MGKEDDEVEEDEEEDTSCLTLEDEEAEYDDEQEASCSWKDLVATWSSGWLPVGKRCSTADGCLVLFQRTMSQSFNVPNKSLEETPRPLQAVVKKTFVHIL